MQIRPPSSTGIRQAQAVAMAFMSLFPCWMMFLWAHGAYSDHRQLTAFEERAGVATAVVTGFKTSTVKTGRTSYTSTQPTVEFVAADGRPVRTRLRYAAGLEPAESTAWVGREIQVRYLLEQPTAAIPADAMQRLPRAGDSLPWLAFPLVLLVILWGSVFWLWPGKTDATKKSGP